MAAGSSIRKPPIHGESWLGVNAPAAELILEVRARGARSGCEAGGFCNVLFTVSFLFFEKIFFPLWVGFGMEDF